MKFILIDQVTQLTPGREIATVKALSLAEEYLGDHFPTFPVLPGVLMVEAMVQSAAMLVHITHDFRHSMVVLQEARNIKYKSFVKPGNVLRMHLEAKSMEADSSSYIGKAWIGEQPMVEGRLTLRHFNLADQDPSLAEADRRVIAEMKHRARLVGAYKCAASA